MGRASGIWTSLAGAALAAAAHAQTPLDAAERKAAVEQAAAGLRAKYIYPDIGERAAQALEQALAAGAYDPITDRRTFAERLTADLAAVARDKHMRVRSLSAPLSLIHI